MLRTIAQLSTIIYRHRPFPKIGEMGLTDDLVLKLSEYNHIDSINVNGIVEIRGATDDLKKGVDYFFCKKDLSKYRKVTTSIAMGWYNPLELNCTD